MKYGIIFLSALIIEVCSTFYIRYVSEANTLGMLFFAFIGPFLGLPFIGFMVETKTWKERIMQACSLSLGYFCGCLIVINLIK